MQSDEVAYSIAAMGGVGGIDAGLYQLANMAPEEAMQYIKDAEGVQAGYNMLKGLVLSGDLTRAEAEEIASQHQNPEELALTTRVGIDMAQKAKMKHEDEVRAAKSQVDEIKDLAKQMMTTQGMHATQAYKMAVEAFNSIKGIDVFNEYISVSGQPTPWTLQKPYVSQNYMEELLLPDLITASTETFKTYKSNVSAARSNADAITSINTWAQEYKDRGWGEETLNELKNAYLQRPTVADAKLGFTVVKQFGEIAAETGDKVLEEMYGSQYGVLKDLVDKHGDVKEWDYSTVSAMSVEDLNSLAGVKGISAPQSTADAEQVIAARENTKNSFNSFADNLGKSLGRPQFSSLFDVKDEDLKTMEF